MKKFFHRASKAKFWWCVLPRNNDIKLATGKWLLFLDSDNYLTERALSDAMALAEYGDKIWFVCLMRVV